MRPDKPMISAEKRSLAEMPTSVIDLYIYVINVANKMCKMIPKNRLNVTLSTLCKFVYCTNLQALSQPRLKLDSSFGV